mmetsp:Transcript_65650/g.130028  ORF Transcript_65650/g.130028 Transcript_65650/m.130028 type:complete len:156 (-) Transcript_65650:12-479(-)
MSYTVHTSILSVKAPTRLMSVVFAGQAALGQLARGIGPLATSSLYQLVEDKLGAKYAINWIAITLPAVTLSGSVGLKALDPHTIKGVTDRLTGLPTNITLPTSTALPTNTTLSFPAHCAAHQHGLVVPCMALAHPPTYHCLHVSAHLSCSSELLI